MSTSAGENQPWEHESLPEKGMEPAITADGDGQTSSPSLRPAPTPSVPLSVSSFLEMVVILSHELHTPLTAIEGYTSMLLSQRAHLAPEEQETFLQIIQQAGRRLGKLTERLLEMSQLEAGTIQLELGLVDLSTL